MNPIHIHTDWYIQMNIQKRIMILNWGSFLRLNQKNLYIYVERERRRENLE